MAEFDVSVNIDDKEVKDYVVSEFDPEDVYPVDELEKWATDNGYVKESDIDYADWAERNGYVKE